MGWREFFWEMRHIYLIFGDRGCVFYLRDALLCFGGSCESEPLNIWPPLKPWALGLFSIYINLGFYIFYFFLKLGFLHIFWNIWPAWVLDLFSIYISLEYIYIYIYIYINLKELRFCIFKLQRLVSKTENFLQIDL
jgi:hypothetical protein